MKKSLKKLLPNVFQTIRLAVRHLMFEMSNAFAQEYREAVRPIFLEIGERAELIGSSVLMVVDGRHFVLTAAHVAREASNGTLLLGGTADMYNLPRFLHTVPSDDGKDLYDLAFAELDAERVAGLGKSRFLTPDEVDVDDLAAAGRIYSFIGWPNRTQNLDIVRSHFNPVATVFTGLHLTQHDYPKVFLAGQGAAQISPEIHVAVCFDSTKVVTTRGKAAIGHQHGISGGGLWRRQDPRDPTNDKLVAIVLGAQTKGTRAAYGTRIAFAFEMLRQQFPELDAHLPSTSYGQIVARLHED
jgi:hypothetical protein